MRPNGEVCKTSIRGFKSHPCLRCFLFGLSGYRYLAADEGTWEVLMPANFEGPRPPWRAQDKGAITVDVRLWAQLSLRPTLQAELGGRIARSPDSQNRGNGNGSKRPTSRGARRHGHRGRRHRPDFRRHRIRRGLPGLPRRLLGAVELHSPRDFDP